jgi:hypothetical protein
MSRLAKVLLYLISHHPEPLQRRNHVKRLIASAVFCCFAACGVDQASTNSNTSRTGASSAQLATAGCFNDVFSGIDWRSGEVDFDAIRAALDACFEGVGVPMGPDDNGPGRPDDNDPGQPDDNDPGQPDDNDPGQPGGGQQNSCSTTVSNGVCTVKSCTNGNCTTTTTDVSGGGSCECNNAGQNQSVDTPKAGQSQGNNSSCSAQSSNNICKVTFCRNGSCKKTEYKLKKGERCRCSSKSGSSRQATADVPNLGQPCPADNNCGDGLTCSNPLKETLPSDFARCAPHRE